MCCQLSEELYVVQAVQELCIIGPRVCVCVCVCVCELIRN